MCQEDERGAGVAGSDYILACVFKQESSTRPDDPNFTFHEIES